MKSNRAAVVLEMAFRLQEAGFFDETSLRDNLNISRSTFYRSLSDFRCYLIERRPDIELAFSSKKNAYYFRKGGIEK